jgi:hypothetical protein
MCDIRSKLFNYFSAVYFKKNHWEKLILQLAINKYTHICIFYIYLYLCQLEMKLFNINI